MNKASGWQNHQNVVVKLKNGMSINPVDDKTTEM